MQEGKGRIDSQKSQLRISFLFSAALCVSISLFHHSFLPSHSLAFCFCWLSASPCFCLSLSLSLTPDSVECRSQCLGALLSLSLSLCLPLPHHSFTPLFFASFSSTGAVISPGWAPVAGQLAWLDTAVLNMIFIAYGESRICKITRPGCIYILEWEQVISIALSAVAHRWRLNIARAKGSAVARLFSMKSRVKPLASCLPSYSHPKTDQWNIACSLASKIHHIGPH